MDVLISGGLKTRGGALKWDFTVCYNKLLVFDWSVCCFKSNPMRTMHFEVLQKFLTRKFT